MRPVTEEDVGWIRRGTVVAMSLASALPRGFAVYGVLDLADDQDEQDRALLAALLPGVAEPLIAGRLIRDGAGEAEPGAEHVLYAGWRYRFRLVDAPELQKRIGRPLAPRGFPELLFPADRRWLVSTLWDDSWRSIGTTEEGARRIEAALPGFERVDRDRDLRTTGREPY